MKWPRVTSRPARLEEIEYLQNELAQQADYFEQHDLSKCVVYIVEYDGAIVGMSAIRMQFQVEPVMLFRGFQKHAPHFAQQRATFLLIKELHEWIADPKRNLSGVRTYFCYILGRRMQKLAEHFGMRRVYKNGGKFFAGVF